MLSLGIAGPRQAWLNVERPKQPAPLPAADCRKIAGSSRDEKGPTDE